MIEGGWPYVVCAYAIALSALAALVVSVGLRARYWANRANELDKSKS